MLRTNKSFEQIKREQSRKFQSKLFTLNNQTQSQIDAFVKEHKAAIFVNSGNPYVDDAHLKKLILNVIAKNQHEFMDKLIKAGLDINIVLEESSQEEVMASHSMTIAFGYTPLMAAAKSGHVEMVRLLLSKKALCQHTLHNRISPFGYAVLSGKVDVINVFFAYKLAENPEQGVPVLMLAIGENNYPLFKHLLSLKVLDINSQYRDKVKAVEACQDRKYLKSCLGKTPIEAAIIFKREDIFDLLMQEEVRLAGIGQYSALYYALHANVPAMVDKIIDRSSYVDAGAFLAAIQLNKLDIVKRILDAGKIKLNVVLEDNATNVFFPLREAIKSENVGIINLFLSRAECLSELDIIQAFSVAAEKNHWGLISHCRSKSSLADNVFKRNLTTFLLDAIYGEADGVVKLLLKEDALRINDRGEEGFNPLHWAAMQGRHALVLVLLAAGADPDIKTVVPMTKALSNKNAHVVPDDKTALQLAVLKQKAWCVFVLLRYAYPALHADTESILSQRQVLLTSEEIFAFNVINELILFGMPNVSLGQEVVNHYKLTANWLASPVAKAEGADQANLCEFLFKIEDLLNRLVLEGKVPDNLFVFAGFNQIANLYRYSLEFFKDKQHGTFEEDISLLETFFSESDWVSLFLLVRAPKMQEALFGQIMAHPLYKHIYVVMQGFLEYLLLKHTLFLKYMTLPDNVEKLSSDTLESLFYVAHCLHHLALYYARSERMLISISNNQLTKDAPVSFNAMVKEAVVLLQLGHQAALKLGKKLPYGFNSERDNEVDQEGSNESVKHIVKDTAKKIALGVNASPDYLKAKLLKALVEENNDVGFSEFIPFIIDNRDAACAALQLIIEKNKYDYLQALLKAGLYVNERVIPRDERNTEGNAKTAIMYAAELGRVEMVALLLKSGAQVDPFKFCGLNVLGFAVKSGQWDVLQIFCDHGISLDVQQAFPLLNLAVYFNHAHLIAPLLRNGAPSDKVYAYQFHSQRSVDYCHETASELVGLTQINDFSPLKIAILFDNDNAVSALINAGISAQTPISKDGKTIFFLAAQAGKRSAMKALAEAGAIPCQHSFYYVAIQGNLPDIQFMFEKCKVEARMAMQKKVLQGAIRRGHLHIILYLIEQGMDFNQSFSDGENLELPSTDILSDMGVFTPLMYAIYKNNLPVLNVLLDAGADVHAKSGLGYSLLHFAFIAGCYAAIPLLVKRGLDINEKCKDAGKTVLHLAAEGNHHVLLHDLLKVMRANPAVRDDNAHTALQVAAIKGHIEFVNCFLRILAQKDKAKNVQPYVEKYLNLLVLSADPVNLSKAYCHGAGRRATQYLDEDLFRFSVQILTSKKIAEDVDWQAIDKSTHFSEMIFFLKEADNLLSRSASSLNEKLSRVADYLALPLSERVVANKANLGAVLTIKREDRVKSFIYIDMMRSMWLHHVVEFLSLLKELADSAKGKKLKALDNGQLVLFSNIALSLGDQHVNYQTITKLFYHSINDANDQIACYQDLISTLVQVGARADILLAQREQAVQKAKVQAEQEAILANKKIQEEQHRRAVLEEKRRVAEEAKRHAIQLEKQKAAAIEEANKQALAARHQEECKKKEEEERKRQEESSRLQAVQMEAQKQIADQEASKILSTPPSYKHPNLDLLAKKTVALLDCVRDAFNILQGIDDVYVCGSTVIAMLDQVEELGLPFIGDVDVFGFNVLPERLTSLGFIPTKLPNVFSYRDMEKQLHIDFYISDKNDLTEEMKVRDLTVRSIACDRDGVVYALNSSYFDDVAWRKLKMVGNPEDSLDSIRLLHIMKYHKRGFSIDPALEKCVEKWSISKDLSNRDNAGHFNGLLLKMLKTPMGLDYVRLLSHWNKLQDLGVLAETPTKALQSLLSILQPRLGYQRVTSMQLFASAPNYVPSPPQGNRLLRLPVGALFADSAQEGAFASSSTPSKQR